MPLVPTWPDILLRLGLAVAAGAAVGFNREERSQAAGLRTTMLVCLAAALMMVLANELLDTTGKDASKFAQIDVLRLPLGVLSGIGFIGGGAIVRRGDIVTGVTTAATIWFMTCVGLCFGAGRLGLGVGATVTALFVLWVLRWADLRIPRKFHATFSVRAQRSGLAEGDLRRELAEAGNRIIAWGVTYEDGGRSYEARAEVEWRGRQAELGREPAFVKAIAERPAVLRAEWAPKPTTG